MPARRLTEGAVRPGGVSLARTLGYSDRPWSSELARPLPMSLPAVVQAPSGAGTSGLVRSEKIGRVRTCQIEPAALRLVEQWIAARRSNWEPRLDRLGHYLAEAEDEPPNAGRR
jgi:hypothetical protein